MPPFAIRPARPDDGPLLAAIGYAAWEQGIFPLFAERPGMRAAEQRRLARVVADAGGRIILAEIDGVPVGWCARGAGPAYIAFLFVSPRFQGLGVGGALLARMESLLELKGVRRVHLETPAENTRAMRFYERQGYRILAMRPQVDATYPAYTSVRLEKRLAPYAGPLEDGE